MQIKLKNKISLFPQAKYILPWRDPGPISLPYLTGTFLLRFSWTDSHLSSIVMLAAVFASVYFNLLNYYTLCLEGN